MNKQAVFSPVSFKKLPIRRGAVFGMILLAALLAFEIFNYSTTDFALFFESSRLLAGLPVLSVCP